MSCIAFAEHKGREEGFKNGVLRTAQKMKSLGILDKDIAECTGLSVEEISNLSLK
jgi:predicted transposase/invertase (TIGR01784 family)